MKTPASRPDLATRRAVLLASPFVSAAALAACGSRVSPSGSGADFAFDPVTAPHWASVAPEDLENFVGELDIHDSEDGAAFSDDGRYILLCRTLQPCNEIEFIDTKEGTITTIALSHRLLRVMHPTFAPGGHKFMISISPPLYRGVSNVVEIDPKTLAVRTLVSGEPSFFHHAVYNADGESITCCVTEGPRTTPDQRHVRYPGYRDGFFSRIFTIGRGGRVCWTPKVYLVGVRGLSIRNKGTPAFLAAAWGEYHGLSLVPRKLEDEFPDFKDETLLVVLEPGRSVRPVLAFDPSELIRQLNAANIPADEPHFLACTPSGMYVYIHYTTGRELRRIVYSEGRLSVSAALRVWDNFDVAVNRSGVLAAVGRTEPIPGVGLIDADGAPNSVVAPGELTRLPRRLIQYRFIDVLSEEPGTQ